MSLINSPSAIYWPSRGSLICFVTAFVQGEKGVYARFWDGQNWFWTDPEGPPGTVPDGSPSAVYRASLDRVMCFTAAEDNHLHDAFLAERQWVWEDRGLPSDVPSFVQLSPPAAVYQPPLDRVICFVVSSEGELLDVFWDGRNWVWEHHGRPFGVSLIMQPPSVVYQSAIDRIHCFVLGEDFRLYERFWSGQGWMWQHRGTPPGVGLANAAPSAVYQASSDRIICFVRAGDQLYDTYWNGRGWVWEPQGKPSGGYVWASPSAVYQPSLDRVICFVVSGDGLLFGPFNSEVQRADCWR
jgi:hypothetical protein